MPLNVPVRYRVKTLRSGKKIRLAFMAGRGPRGGARVAEVAKLRKGRKAKVLHMAPGVSKV